MYGQAILVWSAVQLSEELDLLLLFLETLSIFALKLAGWLPGDRFTFQFQHQVSLDKCKWSPDGLWIVHQR